MPLLGPFERMIYRIGRIDPERDQSWSEYAVQLLLFSFVTVIFTYVLLRVQAWLPLNPQKFAGLSPDFLLIPR